MPIGSQVFDLETTDLVDEATPLSEIRLCKILQPNATHQTTECVPPMRDAGIFTQHIFASLGGVSVPT